MNKPTFNFSVPSDLLVGINRLSPVLGFELGDGITVFCEYGDKNGVVLKDGKATIFCTKKNLFFRELGVLMENIKKNDEFEIFEDSYFKTVGTMVDASRCAVPTVDSMKRLFDRLALMGYDLAMLYTEDTVKLEGRPYFGYMRGAYSKEEIVAMDDYAFEYGIELIPCLECYGHMEKYLIWQEAASIKDTERILLAREEKTFEFLDQLIGHVSSCYRSRRIHIGMDEAHGMGRGVFMNKHGYVEPFDIFTEYMERLIAITDKYGLKPMMWSDMYFRNASKTGQYYDKNAEIPQEVAQKIPKNVQLVFWHYGEMPHCDDYMLKKHVSLERDVIFAGGLWGWIGHFPEHNYALESTKFSLDACRNNGVTEAVATIWSNDNAECDLFTNLYGLSFFSELCFDQNASDEKLKARFEATSGGIAEAFYAMSYYHDSFENADKYPRYNYRFFGKPLFWQDIMEGLFDYQLKDRPMSGHYAASCTQMKEFSGGEWDYLYDFAAKVFDYLAVKTLIAEHLVPAYKSGNKDELEEIANTLLPILKEKTVAVHEAHKAMWFANNKILGWSNLDIRYGGMAARCDTASYLINRYLGGEDSRIEELEEPRLYKPLSGFIKYGAIVTPNICI